jgi:hypothetical protein
MSETIVACAPIKGRVCEVCLNVGKDYYKTLLKVEKQIHCEYRVKFKKYYALFSKIDKRLKADWMLAYVRTQDYEDTYHSDVLNRDIEILLNFHDMKIEYIKEMNEYVILIEGKKYFGHLSQMKRRDSN